MSLEGKVAIITACGRGIGREIALTLARNGCRVAVNSHSNENTRAIEEEIKRLGVDVLGIPGDITQAVVITQMVSETLETFGQIDILINNVGGTTMKQPADPDAPLARIEALWDGTYELSLKAPVLMCEAVIPHFIERNTGKIVNMSSIAGHSGLPHIEVTPIPFCYHSMKAGITRYTQLLADQLGPHNINVNSICPGIIYTDAWKSTAEQMVEHHPKFKGQDPREWFLGIGQGRYREDGMPATPMRREQTTTDIAEATLFLVSDAAANITGQSLTIDGGMVKN